MKIIDTENDVNSDLLQNRLHTCLVVVALLNCLDVHTMKWVPVSCQIE